MLCGLGSSAHHAFFSHMQWNQDSLLVLNHPIVVRVMFHTVVVISKDMTQPPMMPSGTSDVSVTDNSNQTRGNSSEAGELLSCTVAFIMIPCLF